MQKWMAVGGQSLYTQDEMFMNLDEISPDRIVNCAETITRLSTVLDEAIAKLDKKSLLEDRDMDRLTTVLHRLQQYNELMQADGLEDSSTFAAAASLVRFLKL